VDKDKLIKRLMATFLEELEEHVCALNRDLLSLEKSPVGPQRAECLKTLFRTAHSLKGASRSVNVNLIESACHQLEDILSAARDGNLALGPDQFALLFQTADAIEEAAMRLREQQDLSGAPLATLLPRLEAAAREAGGRSPSAARSSGAPSRTPERGPQPGPAEGTGPERRPKNVSEEEQPAVPDAAESALPAAAAESAPDSTTAGGATVRVSAEKLDALLAQSGEMLVTRRRVHARVEELTTIKEFVKDWKAEWRGVEKALAKGPPENGRAGSNGPARPEGALATGVFPRRVAAALDRVGGHLRRLEKDLERLATELTEDSRLLKQVTGTLDDDVRHVRMLPFAEACQGLDRMVRDLARAADKEAEVVIAGGDVELDRSVLEGLKDPLRHLVRNAVDHGIEPAAERRGAGKPPQARVTVEAVLRGGHVEVVVADDGRGINLDALRQQARKRKLAEPADDRELARLIYLPGLSTSRIITDVSGRGVGLDVVKSRVEALHGTVDLSFQPKAGTRFTLAVPLTLTTLRALFVQAGGQTFAVAGTNVHKLVRVDPAGLRSVEGREVLSLGGPALPVASLAETLGLTAREPARPGGKVPLMVVAAGVKRMAFAVDEFLAEQEIMVKGLGARIHRVRHASAATILPSGQIALVLNAANLIRSAVSRVPGQRLAEAPAQAVLEGKKRVLVAEDSLTTRTLVKSILEAAGYEVAVAADGAAAWQLLQERGADVLVSDVDMPRLDGFALTEAVRGSKRFADLPVVLVTARETEEDKARGIEVRADAYLVKSAFDQTNLLQAIAQLL
jgi:two-component system chemotaxis sensor kinase CheA